MPYRSGHIEPKIKHEARQMYLEGMKQVDIFRALQAKYGDRAPGATQTIMKWRLKEDWDGLRQEFLNQRDLVFEEVAKTETIARTETDNVGDYVIKKSVDLSVHTLAHLQLLLLTNYVLDPTTKRPIGTKLTMRDLSQASHVLQNTLKTGLLHTGRPTERTEILGSLQLPDQEVDEVINATILKAKAIHAEPTD